MKVCLVRWNGNLSIRNRLVWRVWQGNKVHSQTLVHLYRFSFCQSLTHKSSSVKKTALQYTKQTGNYKHIQYNQFCYYCTVDEEANPVHNKHADFVKLTKCPVKTNTQLEMSKTVLRNRITVWHIKEPSWLVLQGEHNERAFYVFCHQKAVWGGWRVLVND